MYISKEIQFLSMVLFSQKKPNKNLINNIDFDEIVKTASKHLMLPALYVNFKKKGYNKYLPNDLIKFLKKIYKINNNRNLKLLEEKKEIQELFESNGIKFIFIKGASLFDSQIYENKGERMIGDIDILVEKKHLQKAFNLLIEKGYKSKGKYLIWQTKHLPRLKNKNKLFAIELHQEVLLIRKKNLLNSDFILNNYVERNLELIEKICILNYQINDFGHLTGTYSLRAFYDIHLILKKKKDVITRPKGKYYRRFFLIYKLVSGEEYNVNKKFVDAIYFKRLKIKYRYNIIYQIDNLICKFIIETPKKIMQSLEFIVNKNYRLNILKSIR